MPAVHAQGRAEGSSPQKQCLPSLEEGPLVIRTHQLCLFQESKAGILPPQRNRPKGDTQRTRRGKSRKPDGLKTPAFFPHFCALPIQDTMEETLQESEGP